MNSKTALTADQVRANFRRQGVPVTQWARQHGYDVQAVYRVIGGRDKANYGRAHEIAVALGMKVPTSDASPNEDDQPSTATGRCNTQRTQVA